MRDRFEQAVKGRISYARATLYVRLASFLLKYPRFVNQVHLVTVAGWFESGDGGVVLDMFEKRLSDGFDTFWEGHEEVDGGAEEVGVLHHVDDNPIFDVLPVDLGHGFCGEMGMGHLGDVGLALETGVC